MKKKLSKLTAFVLALAIIAMQMPLLTHAAVVSENLAGDNFGFELNTLDGWTKSADSLEASVTSADSHTGDYSAIITNRTDNNDSLRMYVDIKPNTDYYISAWVKPVVSGVQGRGRLKLVVGSANLLTDVCDFSADTWTKVAGIVNTGATTEASGYVSVNTTTSGTAADTNKPGNKNLYIDDFEIFETTSGEETEGNLLTNAGFETDEDTSDTVGWRNSTGENAFTRVCSLIEAAQGNYYAFVTNRTTNWSAPKQIITVSPDTYYYLAASVKLGSEAATAVRAKTKMQSRTTGSAAITDPHYGNDSNVSANEYTRIQKVVYNTDATEAQVYVQTDETIASGSTGADLLIDDFVALPITSSIANGTTDVIPNSSITLTVPEGITVNENTVNIDKGAKVEKVTRTGRKCVVYLSGMINGVTYTLSLNTGLNTDCTPKWSFTTRLNYLSPLDPTFETGFDTTKSDTELYWHISSSTSARSSEQSHSGTYSVKVSGRTGNFAGPQAQNIQVSEGKTYYLSAWVYASEADKKAQLTFQGSNVTYRTDPKTLTKDGWTKISGTFTSTVSQFGKLFVQTSETASPYADIYIDDFELADITGTTPATVVEGNLVTNGDFETGDSTGWREDGPSFSVVKSIWDAHTGNYAAKTTGRNYGYATPQQYVELTPDTYYYISAQARLVSSAADTVKAKMRLEKSTGETAITVPADANDKELNEDEYTKVSAVVYNTDSSKAKIYVNTTEGDTYADLWTDDYVVLPITSSLPNGATDIAPNSDITLTVPEDIPVTTSTLTIDGGASVTGVDRTGRKCVVHFSGMTCGTTYKLTLNTGLNANGYPQWQFTTVPGSEITINGGFELGTAGWNVPDASLWYTTNKDSAAGSHSIRIKGRANTYSTPQQFLEMENGKTYTVSLKAKVSDGNGSVEIMYQTYKDGVAQTAVSLCSGTASSSSWTQLKKTFTLNAGDFTKIKIFAKAGNEDLDYYAFDEFRVWEGSEVGTASENLVSNPGFEDGTDGWTLTKTTRLSYPSISSGYIAKVSNRQYNYEGPVQEIALQPNTDYYISARIRAYSGTMRGNVVLTGEGIENPSYVEFSSDKWTKVGAVVNSGSNSSASLGILTEGSADYYVDDFSVVPYITQLTTSSSSSAVKVNPEDISSAGKKFAYNWDFHCNPGTAHILAGWTLQVGTNTLNESTTAAFYPMKPVWENGITRLDITMRNGNMFTNQNESLGIDAGKYKYISIKAQNLTQSDSFRIGWWSNGNTDTRHTYTVKWPENQGVQEIVLDLSKCSTWSGTIDALMFSPADKIAVDDDNIGLAGEHVLLESISVFANESRTEQTVTESSITRAEFVDMLVDKLELTNYYTKATAFDDVDTTTLGYDSILTAEETGIITGEGSFNPNDNITREQAATMLMRACTYFDKQTDRVVEPVVFDDAADFSDGMQVCASWAIRLGMISGNGVNDFEPQGAVTGVQALNIINKAVAWVNGTASGEDVFVSAPISGTYDIVRLTVDDINDGAYKNPYDYNEVKADAVFTAPDGTTFTIPGYFDMIRDFEYEPRRRVKDVSQISQWKFRFAPTMEGVWSFEIRLTYNGAVSVLGSGTITAVYSGRPGFIEKDASNPRFVYENGEVFNPFGINLKSPIRNSDMDGYVAYEDYLKKYAQDNGINVLRAWFQSDDCYNLEDYQTGVGKFSNVHAQKLDYVFALARQNGVSVLPAMKSSHRLQQVNWLYTRSQYLSVTGGPLDYGAEFYSNAETIQGFKNLLRFLIARYSAYDNLLLWEFFNEEAGITGWRDNMESVSAWHDQMLQFVADTDPYNHATGGGGRTLAAEPELYSKEMTDFTVVHSYDLLQPALMIRANAQINKNLFNKPNIIEELSIREELITLGADDDGRITHEALWSSIAAGNAATLPAWWWWETTGWADKFEHWNMYGPVSEFMKDFNWPDENLKLVNFKTDTSLKGDFIIPAGYQTYEQYDYDNFPVKDEFTYDLTSSAIRQVDDIIYESSIRKGDFYTFTITLPKAANFVVTTVGEPIRKNATGTLEIYVDPVQFGDWMISNPKYTKDITVGEYMTKHTVSVSAGKHTIKIRNNSSDGNSFYLGWVGIENSVPRVVAEGAVGDSSAMIFVRDTKTVYSEMMYNGYTPVEISDATVDLTGLNDGTYNLIWWDTYNGGEVSRQEITVTGGVAPTVNVPAFTNDIAAKIIPHNSVPAPVLTSDILDVDNSAHKIVMTEAVSNQLSDMSAIKDVITSDTECSITTNDKDSDGFFSDGDTVVAAPVASQVSYTYTVDVITRVNAKMEAFTVDGESVAGKTITKTGTVKLTYRMTNNMFASVAPTAIAVLYDGQNRMVSCTLADSKSVETGKYTDFVMQVDIPEALTTGSLEILVWQNRETLNPFKKVEKYIISVQ
ncbi:MAG: carbohydrate binding domain-containing protein [Clostridia bacterium]|nr:carbohydrate binding domain-containing protein [Clostridia bacterium]